MKKTENKKKEIFIFVSKASCDQIASWRKKESKIEMKEKM
jgi:hypothetical protein